MSMWKQLLRSPSLGTPKSSARPARRANRLPSLENLETRLTPAVTNVDITSITAAGDRDCNQPEHVQITAGTPVNVTFNYTTSGGTTNSNRHLEIWNSGFTALLKTSVDNVVPNEVDGSH